MMWYVLWVFCLPAVLSFLPEDLPRAAAAGAISCVPVGHRAAPPRGIRSDVVLETDAAPSSP